MKEIRRQRLRELLETRFRGSQARFGRAVDLSSGRVSQLFDDRQPFGEDAARKIEGKLGLPPNWLDGIEGGAAAVLSPHALEIAQRLDAVADHRAFRVAYMELSAVLDRAAQADVPATPAASAPAAVPSPAPQRHK